MVVVRMVVAVAQEALVQLLRLMGQIMVGSVLHPLFLDLLLVMLVVVVAVAQEVTQHMAVVKVNTILAPLTILLVQQTPEAVAEAHGMLAVKQAQQAVQVS